MNLLSLSVSVESSNVINDSVTVNPTLVVSVFELNSLSNNVCLLTFTNCPLM